ncbi:MAG: DNA-directed RNA polymerase subunit D [Candidatus Aenigmarchaeota archaeon]|nr:DNA-directed RNA polymerase subunit D [Candidatus Aenigmarchaeota archaeon]
MKIKILSKKGSNLKFLLDDTTPGFANALRRIMISEVPTLAIEIAEFTDNTSALFDEMIAHRFGLIPLEFDPSKFNFKEECKCNGKGCPLCEVFFALEKTGPVMVYSGDLKSTNKAVKPISPDFPMVELLKDQNLKLEAIAVLGTGKNHAKFQAANASYTYFPQIDVSDHKDAKKIEKACPRGVLAVKNSKLVLADPYNCNECRSCEDASNDKVKVNSDNTKFIFNVDSISGLDVTYIVEQASKILQDKANEFKDQLKGF